jgi:RNA polymerase sigma factor (sigma-70 family)
MNDEQKIRFESIYQQYHPMVLQMCTGFMKGDRVQASDLAQEVFINTWMALPQFRGESSHKTWIYRITVNTCLQHIRKEKSRAKNELEAGIPTIEQSASTDGHQDLYRAIGSLNDIDRLIITMVLDDLDYEEIAKVVGIQETNLRVRIHRIKGKLKEKMEHGQRI